MKVGDVVADFVLPDERGRLRSLTGLLSEGALVLFFYPGAFTSLCTAQACRFRDVAADLRSVGAQPVGVSCDFVERQAAFAEAHRLGFPLLSDPGGEVRAQFGVRRTSGPWPTKRVTFVIDPARRVIEVIRSEIRVNLHADRALLALRQHGFPRIPPRPFSWWYSDPAS